MKTRIAHTTRCDPFRLIHPVVCKLLRRSFPVPAKGRLTNQSRIRKLVTNSESKESYHIISTTVTAFAMSPPSMRQKGGNYEDAVAHKRQFKQAHSPEPDPEVDGLNLQQQLPKAYFSEYSRYRFTTVEENCPRKPLPCKCAASSSRITSCQFRIHPPDVEIPAPRLRGAKAYMTLK